jgi:FkbM family methyltransferase
MLFEQLLYAYSRHFPIQWGKYRFVERLGVRPGAHGSFIRRTQLQHGKYVMDCDLRKQLQRQFHYFGTYLLEARVLKSWSAFATDARTVLDVGANAGIYSLAATASSAHVRINAFEPTPEIASHLRATAALNGLADRLLVHECAVGAECGSIWLNRFSGEKNDNEGMNFVSTDRHTSGASEVPMVSLDDFCAEAGLVRVDLLKVDVQGSEPAVFRGARNLIERKAVRTIFFELNWNHDNPMQCAAGESTRMLSDAGYRFADPNGRMKFQQAGSWLEKLSDVVASA